MRLSTTIGLVLGCVLFLGAGAAFGNLIANGNFELGGTAFGSQYQPAFNNTTLGQVTVGATPSQWNPFFTNPTPSSGQMLMVNGGSSALAQVWSFRR